MKSLKVLHTADWHIGQTLHHYDRAYEHRHFLEWLLGVIEREQPDLLLVAGDLFDSPNPSAGSQRLFNHFLHRLMSRFPTLQALFTAGNHDSGRRLEALCPLLEGSGCTVVGELPRDAERGWRYDHLLVPVLRDGQPIAYCIALPYVRYSDYPPHCVDYSSGVAYHVSRVRELLGPTDLPVLLVAHFYSRGATLSVGDEAERVVVGGLQQVDLAVFPTDLAYVALGHIHKPQRLGGGGPPATYPGAPLPMTFGEQGYRQGVQIVEVDLACSECRLSFCPYEESPVRLQSLSFTSSAELLEALALLPGGTPDETSPILEINLSITEPSPSLRADIEEALRGKAVRLGPMRVTTTPGAADPDAASDAGGCSLDTVRSLDPVAMGADVYRKQYGQEMPAELKKLLQEIVTVASEPPKEDKGDWL